MHVVLFIVVCLIFWGIFRLVLWVIGGGLRLTNWAVRNQWERLERNDPATADNVRNFTAKAILVIVGILLFLTLIDILT